MKLLHGEIDADFQLDFCLPERRLLSRHFQFKNLKVFINCMLFVIGNENNASKLHRLRNKRKYLIRPHRNPIGGLHAQLGNAVIDVTFPWLFPCKLLSFAFN